MHIHPFFTSYRKVWLKNKLTWTKPIMPAYAPWCQQQSTYNDCEQQSQSNSSTPTKKVKDCDKTAYHVDTVNLDMLNALGGKSLNSPKHSHIQMPSIQHDHENRNLICIKLLKTKKSFSHPLHIKEQLKDFIPTENRSMISSWYSLSSQVINIFHILIQ